MKVVLLAGGLGTRLAEETNLRPKPMVEIGGRPILWHIMKIYSYYGFNEFIICAGYMKEYIIDYFSNYSLRNSNVYIDLTSNDTTLHVEHNSVEPWKIHIVDTGLETLTGGRLGRVRDLLQNESEFMFTYGDGVADIDLSQLLNCHKQSGKLATVTATYPPARFGALDITNSLVTGFKEKPTGDGNMINGGFFVLSPSVFDLIDSDMTVWEQEPMESLAKRGQLNAYIHHGFWRPMDTLRDKLYLNELLSNEAAPWVKW